MEGALQALIAAIISFFVISSIFLFIFLCRDHAKTRPRIQYQSSLPLSRPKDESASFDPSVDQISMSELIAATKNFSCDRIVGDGSFGFVYKARLSSGATVAAKKLSADAFHGFREFRAEMETLGRIRHPNLTRILGYCISGLDRILIYEFLENGSLDQWLHDEKPPDGGNSSKGRQQVEATKQVEATSGSDNQQVEAEAYKRRQQVEATDKEPQHVKLSWKTRVRIVKGVAAGLSFLHEECKIIHRDIKASNVLLDGEFAARIADFGLARRVGESQSHVSTQVAGTMGYMPPEYRAGAVATVKADVYSFGILMYEVATGRRPSWPVKGEDGKELWFVRWARGMVEGGRGLEMVDGVIKEGLVGIEEEVKEFLRVAYVCTEESARKRPSMQEVMSLLESATPASD